MFTLRVFLLLSCFVIVLILLFYFSKKKSVSKQLQEKEVFLQKDKVFIETISNEYRHKEIIKKLDDILKKDKLYTKCDLSLNDIAEVLGTNRTYVSAGINSFYKQNFSSYLNNYRWGELQNLVEEDESICVKELASRCGFGSLDSLNRTAKLKTGLTFKEWKNTYINSDIS